MDAVTCWMLLNDLLDAVTCRMLPYMVLETSLTYRHRLHRDADHMHFEREVCTLDVPYGESFCLQVRV